MCDAVARWFQLHPSALAPLDHQTVTRMASRVGVTTVAHPRSRTSSAILEIDGFLMDRQRRTAHAGHREVSLTPTEFELLLLLLSRTDALHSSAELTRRLWGSDADRHRRSLFVYIRRLRAKLEPGHVPFRITTVFGRGYRIDRRLR
jgi:DNA-binding response OmpR family regulator